MSRRKGWVWLTAAPLLLLTLASVASADEQGFDVDKSLHKLGRGIANVALGAAELIRTPELVSRREGYLPGVTVGVVQGVWRTLLREAAGVYEVATFFIDVPHDGAPLIRPEFVWEHGNWAE